MSVFSPLGLKGEDRLARYNFFAFLWNKQNAVKCLTNLNLVRAKRRADAALSRAVHSRNGRLSSSDKSTIAGATADGG